MVRTTGNSYMSSTIVGNRLITFVFSVARFLYFRFSNEKLFSRLSAAAQRYNLTNDELEFIAARFQRKIPKNAHIKKRENWMQGECTPHSGE